MADELLRNIGRARVYDLGHPYWAGMPLHPADPPFQYYLYRYHEHTKKLFESMAPGFSDSIGLVVTSMHSGTHFDAPIHMARDLKVQGQDITRYEQDKGYVDLPEKIQSIDKVPPLVKKGVLLDIAGYKKTEPLPERYEITPEDLQGAADGAQIRIGEGDCVLIRTGYSRLFNTDADGYLHRFAGLGPDATRWLAKMKVGLVGIDNLAAGVMPKHFEVQNIILSDNGIFLMKSLNLEELARDKKYTSVVIVAPLKIKGAEASLVRPIAIA
ncbi:MAG: cyclase family protein [Thaumarchaeota archaeon]|nr:cyclase family protein [Nitrososphaerota archaeon]